MRKKGLVLAAFFLFLSASLLIRGERSFPRKAPGQGQPERPKFYALRVAFEKKVQNAEDALGMPDGLYAEILPGGQLVLFMEEKIYYFTTFDGGSIVGKGEADYGLEGWFPMQDPQGKQTYGWLPLALGDSPGGFRLSPIEPTAGTAGVDMIRIANAGTKSFFVDAVIGYGVEAERK